jgi:alcohol dehydrogenase class IV
MAELFFRIPSKILQGVNEVNRAGIEISRLGKRVLIIADSGLKDPLWKLQGLVESHGVKVIIFNEEVLHGTSYTIETCINLAKGSFAESLIGFGGGRTLSIARAVASALPNGLHPDDLFSSGTTGKRFMPYVEIPTTFWTPYLLQACFPITESRGLLTSIVRGEAHPDRVMILDPVLSLPLQERQRISLFFELMLFCLSAVLHPKRSFLTEVHCRAGFQTLWKERENLIKKWDMNTVVSLAEAGILVSLAQDDLSFFWPGLLIHSVSGYLQVSRSIVSQILLPYIMDHLLETSFNEMSSFLASLSDKEDLPGTPADLLDSIREWIGYYSMPSQLRSTGGAMEQLALAAETAGGMMSRLDAGGITVDQLFQILKSSW